MRIQTLHLKNFRCFQDFTLRFSLDHNVHVVLAENMVGKSGIMEALRVNLGIYTSGLLQGPKPGLALRDHRVIGDNPGYTLTSDCSVETEAVVSDERRNAVRVNWKRYRDRPTGNNTKTIYRKAVGLSGMQAMAMGQGNLIKLSRAVYDKAMEAKAELPLFNYVGTDYSHVLRAETKDFELRASAAQGYQEWFMDKSIQKSLFNWFGLLEALNIESSQKELVADALGSYPRDAYWAFKHAVSAIIPEITDLSWYAEERKMVVRFATGEARFFEMLSDGYRYLLILAGELATRAVMLNKHLGREVFERTNGVVLIDEFGIHLHPSLQTDALKRLSKLFPHVQFIITTHSPMLINGLRKEQIYILEAQEDGTRTVRHPEDDAIGLGANGILTEMFGLATTMDSEYLRMSGRYRALYRKKTEQGLDDAETAEFVSLKERMAPLQLDPEVKLTEEDSLIKLVREKLAAMDTGFGPMKAFDANDLSAQVDEVLKSVFNR